MAIRLGDIAPDFEADTTAGRIRSDGLAAGCEDSLPIYPWRRAELRALGLEPVISRPRPHRPRSRRVTAAEARERAGPMHRRVIEWLDRREAWMAPPRTGRPFCR